MHGKVITTLIQNKKTQDVRGEYQEAISQVPTENWRFRSTRGKWGKSLNGGSAESLCEKLLHVQEIFLWRFETRTRRKSVCETWSNSEGLCRNPRTYSASNILATRGIGEFSGENELILEKMLKCWHLDATKGRFIPVHTEEVNRLTRLHYYTP